MNAQLEMTYADKATRSKRGPRLAARMIAVLWVKRRWVTRREFIDEHGFSSDGRECRLGCECAHMRIIFGAKGYQLLAHSTPDEIYRCYATIKKQRKALERREIQITKRAHEAIVKKGAAI